MSYDLTKLGSRYVPAEHWRTHKHVTWSTHKAPPLGAVQVGDVVHKYGQSFVWTPEHQTAAEMMPTRQLGDPLADRLVRQLAPSASDDLIPRIEAAIRDPEAEADPSVCALAAEVGRVPEWVDWTKIRQGQQVFAKYAVGCGMSLYFISLVGGFSAPLIVRVLRATGYLTAQPKAVMRRLMDTGSMITACLGPAQAADALQPGGEGWRAAVQVRLLHTKVRRRLIDQPDWDTVEWGVPINQMDMQTTLLAFSYNVIIGLELLLGRPLLSVEQEAYLHLWRYIGFLLGVDEKLNPCTSVQRAKATLESSIMCILEPDRHSVDVAQHLLSAPGSWGYPRRSRMCRRMLGEGLADALKLPSGESSWADWWCELSVACELRLVRGYLRLAQWPVIGPALTSFHWYTIRCGSPPTWLLPAPTSYLLLTRNLVLKSRRMPLRLVKALRFPQFRVRLTVNRMRSQSIPCEF